MTIQYSHYGLPNTPPQILNVSPTGSEERSGVEISFQTVDDRGQIVLSTLQVTLTFDPLGTPIEYDVIINGVFEPSYGGSITANAYNGYDVVIDTYPHLADGLWQADVYVEDDEEESDSESWQFTILTMPYLIAVRAIGRRLIECEFDLAVRVRASNLLPVPPDDRYTPVEWPGESYDAANPDNYVITRVEGGALSLPGEAVELTPTWAYEHPDHAYEDSGVWWSTHVWVVTDYDHTARADYNMEVSNIRIVTPAMHITDFDFLGYVASQVPRQSLILYETLPGVIKRIDYDGTGDLEKFFRAIQEVFNRLTEDVDAFFNDLCAIDIARPEFLDAILYDLGNPFAGKISLTILEKRKLISLLVQMYREKGTCQGIVNAVRVFTGITLLGCSSAWGDCWILGQGSYPTPENGSELGEESYLGPGAGDDIWSFWLYYGTPGSLTADELAKIEIIVDYMKPAGTYYLGVIAP